MEKSFPFLSKFNLYFFLTLVLFLSAFSSLISSSLSSNVSRACVSSFVKVANSYKN